MEYKKIDIGIIIYPSFRSSAYLCEFVKRGIVPQEIIYLKKKPANNSKIIEESRKFYYKKDFFDLEMDILEAIDNSVKRIFIDNDDVNGNNIKEALKKCTSKYFIFTGGGILSEDVLALKQFIHVHPGIVPEYRGSTCFYYSILEKYSLGSTAFVMNKGIDTGQIICTTAFTINYKIEPEQVYFFDYVADPYIRAYTLGKVLDQLLATNKIIYYDQVIGTKPNYFIIHPFLRHLALNKINYYFKKEQPVGIFENQ